MKKGLDEGSLHNYGEHHFLITAGNIFQNKSSGIQQLQWSPLVWSTDVRSTRLYGQFLVGPKQNGLFISVKARFKVKNARLYGQNLNLFEVFCLKNRSLIDFLISF